MKKIDVYILKKYFSTFIFMMVAFLMLVIVIDFAEKNDDFMKHDVPMDKIIGEYYLNLIPFLANFLSPLFIFLSTIFVTARMASHTEIVAILSSGVSLVRVLWSFTIGAILISLITFYMIGWVIPKSNTERIKFEWNYLTDHNGNNDGLSNMHVRIGENEFAYIQYWRPKHKRGNHFTLEKFDKDHHLIYKLHANEITWDSIGGQWKVGRNNVRLYENGKETFYYKRAAFDTVLTLVPSDFEKDFKMEQALTIPELKAYIKEKKEKGTGNVEPYIIEYYERFTYPFATIILTIIGVIVSARKTRESYWYRILIGFVLCFCYFALLQLGRNFTQSDAIHPLLGAWIPNIVFSCFGVFLYRALPK